MSLETSNTAKDYVIGVVDDPCQIDAEAWDGLLARQAQPTPFMRHAYLAALHVSGSATARSGWSPRFLTLHQDGRLVGATALYLKTHSYGEYVFDWAWADAYRRHGLRYYPKLLGAVPFTPVPGTRLLALDDAARDALVAHLLALADAAHLSSAHVLFIGEADRAAFARAGWMPRETVQFHWMRDAAMPAADFDGFVATMQRHKRKNILQERRRVRDAGVSFSVHEADAIDESLWDFFYQCYTGTYEAHGSTPYLTRAFFTEMSRTMPAH